MMWDVTKFSFIQLLVAVAAAWTIYTLAPDSEAPNVIQNRWPLAIGGILSTSYIFSLLAILILAKLRVYFVRVARYINKQRHLYLSATPLGFQNSSRFYTDPNLPQAFDPLSTHMLTSGVIALAGSFALAGSVGAFVLYFNGPSSIYIWSACVSGIASVVLSQVFVI